MSIRDNVRQVLRELPEGVQLVAAAKSRKPEEIREAVVAGAKIIGENYVQEAEKAFHLVGSGAEWHFIGHLQRNKVKKAISLFDMVETVDSVVLAAEIEKGCAHLGKTMPVLVEINSGREKQKSGVLPEEAEGLIKEISGFPHVRVKGLMTMGSLVGDSEDSRACFQATKKVFDRLKQLHLPNVEMIYLSMGMTNSYRVALEEGANIIRIGTKLFGEREDYSKPAV
ncbi:YggS family pyridoxal phosphate-dependent enzyme [Chloroflexota bacterium]